MRAYTFVPWLAALAGLAGLASPRAKACSIQPPPWESDPWSVTDPDDRTPPSAPPVITGSASAPEAAEGCGSGDLDKGDPGDCSTIGFLSIHIEEPAADDRTKTEQMAYRVEIVDGEAPFPTDVPIHAVTVDGSSPSIFSHISEAKVSAKLRLIPVDAGGNEGPASNVIHLHFDESGCSVLGASNLYSLAPTGIVLLWLVARRRRKSALAIARR